MTAAFAGMIGRHELLVSPTLPHVAAKVEPLLGDDDAFFAMNAKTLRNTQIGNFFDLCGVSIPCGTGEAGMPVGLLLSACTGWMNMFSAWRWRRKRLFAADERKRRPCSAASPPMPQRAAQLAPRRNMVFICGTENSLAWWPSAE